MCDNQIPPAKRGGNKRHVEVREVMNGIMYILSTGCQWRAIPKALPPRSTLFDYLDLWSYDGTLEVQTTVEVNIIVLFLVLKTRRSKQASISARHLSGTYDCFKIVYSCQSYFGYTEYPHI